MGVAYHGRGNYQEGAPIVCFPCSHALTVGQSITIDDVLVDQVTSDIYHLERRPSEGGRTVVVATSEGHDVFGPKWNARTGVQEYGGGAALVHDGVVYFSEFSDGRVYRVKIGEEPQPITPGMSTQPLAPVRPIRSQCPSV